MTQVLERERPLRVLHVIPSLSPLRGGPGIFLRRSMPALVAAGLEVEVAATDDAGPGRDQRPLGTAVREDGVTWWYFPRQVRFYTVSLPLRRWLRQNVARFDLVHIHGLFTWPSTVAARAARDAGVPYILRPLGTLNTWGMRTRRPWLKRLAFRTVESRLLRDAALVHFTSEQERREAELLMPLPSCAVIPLGVNFKAASRAEGTAWLARQPSMLHGRPVLLFLSRIDEKKGLELLLSALAALKRNGVAVALLVAGDGDPALVARLRGEAEALGIGGDVHWAGFLAGDAKRRALAAVDAFVLPSYSENFGVAVVEAMAAGLPVVISDQVGIHDEVAAAGAGAVVRCDADDLAAALKGLLSDQARRAAMGERGRALAASRYSFDAMAGALVREYRAVLDSKVQVPA